MLILPALFAIIAGCATLAWLLYRLEPTYNNLLVVVFSTIAASCAGLVAGLIIQQWMQG